MSCRRLLVFRNEISRPFIAYIPRRGAKQKWGGITRDPYKTFQKKLQRKVAARHQKIPLKSEERAVREMQYPLNINTLGQILSDYTPLEKFARYPIYTGKGLRQRWTGFKESLQIIYAGAVIRRKLKKIIPFKPIEFARWGQEQFVAANLALQKKDKDTIRMTLTESAAESLRSEFTHKIVKWEFLEEIERPRVVNARVAPLTTKDNLYGQVVLRIHSKQILAIYNLAGSLLQGHPSESKNVIDYVVFERSLGSEDVNVNWRICGKLPPQVKNKN